MSRTKRYLLCLTSIHKKTRIFPGHTVTGAAAGEQALHVQDPAVSNIGVEPKGGADFVSARFRLVWGPVYGGL